MGRAWVALVGTLLVLVVPTSHATVRIEGFASDLPNNEDAIQLRNTGNRLVPLGSALLQDGNGALAFPPHATMAANGSIFLTTNRSAFLEAFGREPDFALDTTDEAKRLANQGRTFALSNSGDALSLGLDGRTVDSVLYGERTDTPEGWTGDPLATPNTMFLRWLERTGDEDTNSSRDWIPERRSYVGEELFEPSSPLIDATFFPYLAPEHSRAVVREALLSAQRSVRVNVYQFRDIALAQDLAAHMRATPGLRVDVLLDASPVGESREELSERGHVIETLASAGARAHMFTHARYAYDHAKYAVVDEEVLLVQTENFVPSGIPPNGRDGNRGWGLLVANRSLAEKAAAVFDADFTIRPFGARIAGEAERPTFPLPALASETGSSPPGVTVKAMAPVTIVATPLRTAGHDDPIAQAIRGATSTIEVVQLDLAPRWRSPAGGLVPHVYLDGLVAAAQRGVAVRILLDGHFLDDAPMGDNADTVRLVGERFNNVPIEARLQPPSASILHAKGMIVDGRITLVGSMNWNSNSVLQNRELGLLVEEPTVAAFYRSAFEEDWRAAAPRFLPGLDVGTVLTLAGLALVFAGRRQR